MYRFVFCIVAIALMFDSCFAMRRCRDDSDCDVNEKCSRGICVRDYGTFSSPGDEHERYSSAPHWSGAYLPIGVGREKYPLSDSHECNTASDCPRPGDVCLNNRCYSPSRAASLLTHHKKKDHDHDRDRDHDHDRRHGHREHRHGHRHHKNGHKNQCSAR